MTLKLLATGVAAALVAVAVFGTTDADAQPRRQRDVSVNGPNVSYMAGPRTRVYVTKRSWLDAGTNVQPGERKFQDYAFPPGNQSPSDRALPRTMERAPLSPAFDLGGYPTAFPLY